MAIVRIDSNMIDRQKVIDDLRAAPLPTEEQIDAWVAEDGDEWTDEQLVNAEWNYPPPSAAQIRETRARLGLTLAQFARRFGFSASLLDDYEQGRAIPSGPAASLLLVIATEAEAVARALERSVAR